MNLGMALREQGEADKALEHLRVVAAGDPSNAGVHYEIGQALRQTGDLNGAIAAFDKIRGARSRSCARATTRSRRRSSSRARRPVRRPPRQRLPDVRFDARAGGGSSAGTWTLRSLN